LAAEQEALAHRADRMGGLVDEGFVSKDEAETQRAQSDSKASELVSTRAKLQRATLEVDDCVLRAPFDGEIAARPADPGMFVRPGSTVVVVVQRNAVRVAAEVPETDFALVPRKTRVEVHMLATGLDKVATVSRRAPAADPGTRTVHIELDLDNADHGIPVGTTAELRVDVGEALGATEVPLLGAIVKGERATVWLIDKQTAHKVTARVIGERAGSVFVDAAVVPTGAHVVTEGRGLLREGDKVDAMPDEKHDEKHEVQP
jgi:RND family efflux transporter MFP subunit